MCLNSIVAPTGAVVRVIGDRGQCLEETFDATSEKTLSFIGLGSSSSGRYARDPGDLLAEGFGRD
jgi:hypothetical protein